MRSPAPRPPSRAPPTPTKRDSGQALAQSADQTGAQPVRRGLDRGDQDRRAPSPMPQGAPKTNRPEGVGHVGPSPRGRSAAPVPPRPLSRQAPPAAASVTVGRADGREIDAEVLPRLARLDQHARAAPQTARRTQRGDAHAAWRRCLPAPRRREPGRRGTRPPARCRARRWRGPPSGRVRCRPRSAVGSMASRRGPSPSVRPSITSCAPSIGNPPR